MVEKHLFDYNDVSVTFENFHDVMKFIEVFKHDKYIKDRNNLLNILRENGWNDSMVIGDQNCYN